MLCGTSHIFVLSCRPMLLYICYSNNFCCSNHIGYINWCFFPSPSPSQVASDHVPMMDGQGHAQPKCGEYNFMLSPKKVITFCSQFLHIFSSTIYKTKVLTFFVTACRPTSHIETLSKKVLHYHTMYIICLDIITLKPGRP